MVSIKNTDLQHCAVPENIYIRIRPLPPSEEKGISCVCVCVSVCRGRWGGETKNLEKNPFRGEGVHIF